MNIDFQITPILSCYYYGFIFIVIHFLSKKVQLNIPIELSMNWYKLTASLYNQELTDDFVRGIRDFQC